MDGITCSLKDQAGPNPLNSHNMGPGSPLVIARPPDLFAWLLPVPASLRRRALPGIMRLVQNPPETVCDSGQAGGSLWLLKFIQHYGHDPR
ncbi:hypothetical protein AVEN_69965-1 [Araneus ventricosus]|uniref:Uncharacterized protein n=1 Tax=Araneus ventricosus TaxID=182803 RepID=A0A4Y2V153_ARAVE|nr:hypothetical protein AVEN_69965-1 [Araneus ventricosus]